MLVASSPGCRYVTRKPGVSDVSDEDATSMLTSTTRKICRGQVVSLTTCPQQVVRVLLVEFGERHDTRTNCQHYTPQQTAGRPIR